MPLRLLLSRAQRPLTHYLLWPQLLPFALMLTVIATVIWGIDFSARQNRTLNLAQQRLTVINQIARNVLDSETGLRGYLLTGQDAFLQPYRAGQTALERNLSQLEACPATVLQYQNIQQVRYLMELWQMEVAGPLLRAPKSGSRGALLSELEGKHLMDQTRQVLDVLERNEALRRDVALKDSERALAVTRLLTISGLLLAALLMWLSALRSARALSRVLGDLNRDMAHITQGHYDFRLPQLPITEVQRLGDQFSEMTQAVREREGSLQRSNLDLERSNRELEQFAYIASHDLQEPLRTIGSYTELLAKRYQGQLDARADKYIGFTLAATHRLKRLIQDLLAFSRVRQPGRAISVVDTGALLSEIAQDLESALRAEGAELRVGPLPTVRANPELLRHIFQNLLSNAIKFRDPSRAPVIQVSATRLSGAWQFSVSDNGVGIALEYHERIFGVFQRLSGSEIEGSGIGLAVVRTAVERHGGEVLLKSVLGEGSTFSFTIPDAPPLALAEGAPLRVSGPADIG